MRIFPFILAALGLAVAQPALAAPLELAGLLREADQHNPELEALSRRAAAAEARIPSALALPDPKLTGEWMDLGRPLSPKLQISQMLMGPGKLERMSAVETQMARMARQEFETRRWMVASDVQGVYFDLYTLDRQQRINRESQALLQDMIRVTNARYSVGQGTQADVLRPQLQLTRLMNDQLGYAERYQTDLIRLGGVLGRAGGASGEPPSNVHLSVLAGDREALIKLSARSPMIQMAEADVERNRAALDLAQLGYVPDVELAAGVTPGSGMAPQTTFSAMAGVTLPVWGAQKQHYQIEEAQRNLEAATARLEARRRDLDVQISSLLNQIARMESQLKLLDEGMIPQARTALKANLAAYQTGRGDYLMLLDSFMALYDNRMQGAMLLAEHEKMVGMLEAQLGQTLKGKTP